MEAELACPKLLAALGGSDIGEDVMLPVVVRCRLTVERCCIDATET